MPMFDTHEYVKNLMAAGFTQEQAEAMARGQLQLLEVVVTKKDLQAELAHLEVRMLVKNGVLNAAIATLLFTALSFVIVLAGR